MLLGMLANTQISSRSLQFASAVSVYISRELQCTTLMHKRHAGGVESSVLYSWVSFTGRSGYSFRNERNNLMLTVRLTLFDKILPYSVDDHVGL